MTALFYDGNPHDGGTVFGFWNAFPRSKKVAHTRSKRRTARQLAASTKSSLSCTRALPTRSSRSLEGSQGGLPRQLGQDAEKYPPPNAESDSCA